MKPTGSDFLRSFLRTFAVEGSWNPHSMTAGGLVYALLPLLARIHAGDPVALREAVRRHLEPFNAHPYLTPMAVGSLARMEHQGEDPARIRRYRRALMGPLGAVGDRLVWAGWRPVCLLAGLLAFSLGADPVRAALLFLLSYNAGHLALRAWAFRLGWRDGVHAVRGLTAPALERWGLALRWTGVCLAGATAAALAARIPGAAGAWSAATLAGMGALAGYRWPQWAGRGAVGLVVAASFLWLLS